MNIRNNINYFKKRDAMKGIGGGLLIVSLFSLWIGFGGIFTLIFMMLAVPTGFLMFLIGSIISSNENDIDECIVKKCDGLELDLEGDKNFSKRVMKNIAPNVTQGYEYNGEDLMFRKDKKGTWRSSKYTKSIIYVLSDGLCINSRTFSLVSKEVENRLFEVSYDTINSVEMKKEENTIQAGRKSFKINKYRFVLKYGEGITFSVPMNNDIKSEEFVDMLNRFILKEKEQKSE